MTTSIIRAQLATALPPLIIAETGGVPADIQWMPPGRHTINASGSEGPITMTVDVTEGVAKRIAEMLRAYRSQAAAGTEDLPFFDFDHEDAEASGHPTEFFWAGNDPKTGGVRAKVEWTEAGKQALLGKAYRRFSPEFLADKEGNIYGVPINMGGLVNRAAFKKIQPIWSRDGGDPTQPTQTKQKSMTKTTDEQLAELTTALAALRQDYAAITAKLNTAPDAASVQAKDAKITALETQVTALMDAGKVQAKASAAALVRKAISEGKIPGQDVKVIESWTNLIVIDAKNADLLDSLPVNAALKTIVQAGAGGSGAGGAAAKTDAEQFVEVVKAKHVELKDKSKALDAAMVEKPDLYKAWRAADGKPGL